MTAHLSTADFKQVFGPLRYDEQQLLRRPGNSTTCQGRTIPGPEPDAADADPFSAGGYLVMVQVTKGSRRGAASGHAGGMPTWFGQAGR